MRLTLYRKRILAAIVGLVTCAGIVCVNHAQDSQPPAAKSSKKSGGKSSGKKSADAAAKNGEEEDAKGENAAIGIDAAPKTASHTKDPGAQWYPDAGFGLFIHWGLASVKSMNISWPMIPGRALAAMKITDKAEQDRIIREADFNLNGRPPQVTPNEYWSMAEKFNPQNYDPDKWLKAAKAAGFEYAVLTAKHHEGFALWPSEYGDFNTKNYMGGRDLVKEYVEACRKNGLKVGLYFSGPDWHFDRDYMSFLYHDNQSPWVPSLGPDLKPRITQHTPEEIEEHQKQYAQLVRGQIEELLTRYGQIDLIWFDGKPRVPNATSVISQERIRELQPHIVINPRLHGKGDYVTFERKLGTDKPASGWAEFCNTWTSGWSHQEIPFRANGFVLGQLCQSRALGVNYLLGVGPMKDGQFCDDIYKNMAVVASWMQKHAASVKGGAKPLPSGESASVPATAAGNVRYLFAIPEFRGEGAYDKDQLPPKDVTLELKGAAKPTTVRLMGDGSALEFDYADGTLAIKLPADKRTKLVDVAEVELSK